jgi:predicted lactoylglutathione lyase
MMSRQIFVNLPFKDLHKAIAFFTQLGFTFNPQFTDDTATCMIISESIFAMLLTEAKFQTFTSKAICDATQSTEVLLCFSCESRAEVDDLVRKALPLAAVLTMNRKTTALCMPTVSKT